MSQIKDDLISEIIRVSQTNLLEKKRANLNGDYDETEVMEWIRVNAKNYRENLTANLESFPAAELGDILKCLHETGKDLSELFDNGLYATPASPSPRS
ncbi:MAG: hypothetical protein COV67_13975 [Nitrospinae bacterium CG11_big_fil_rev_8_21_14_0_20_56_8]|nr:MAG: hypothetical protein COV67_13975 [Nitrospinae bacterium CG11_big_fil_rev_8_21_14_0_20_56_8]